MTSRIAFTFVVMVASHLCGANPVPEPDPYHKTHIKVHIPHEVHTVHHHHVEKVPIYKTIPVYHEVPVIKTVPIVKHVAYPVVHTVEVEKPLIVHSEHWGGWH